MVGVEVVDIVEEAVTMASVEQADGAGSVREPDTQVDTEFAEKEYSHDTGI